MHTFFIKFLLIFFIYPKVFSEIQLQFIMEPVSQNVTLGSEALFNCTVTTDYFYWLVNGKQPEHSSNSHRELVLQEETLNEAIGLRTHVLIVPAIQVNNDITIQCTIYKAQKFLRSNIIKLKIQGPLDHVTNLEAVWVNSSSLQVSFSPPDTLKGVPIRNYTIELVILSKTTSDPPFNNCTANITTSITSTTIIINNLSWCFDHNVTVVPINDAGEGKKASLTIQKGIGVPKDPCNISVSKSAVYVNSTIDQIFINALIEINYPAMPDSINMTLYYEDHSEPLVTVTTDIQTLDSNDNDHTQQLLCDSANKSEDLISVSVNLTDYILKGHYYSVTISLANCVGITNSSKLCFDTFEYRNTEQILSVSSFTSISNAISPNHHTFSAMPSTESIDVDTTKLNHMNSSWIPGLTTSLCLFIGSLIIFVIVLIGIIIKYRKRSKRLLLAEMNVHQQKMSVQVILDSITITDGRQNFTNTSHIRGLSPTIEDSAMYENVNEIQSSSVKTMNVVDCAAYVSLPIRR